MKIVEGIDIDKVYTADEIADLFLSGRLRGVTLHGYVSQADAEGNCRFVPYTKSDAFNMRTGARTYVSKEDLAANMKADVEREHPIVRRTPQQRKESLVLRLRDDIKRHGRVPGLSDQQHRDILGPTWTDGRTDITLEEAGQVAAHYLARAEAENKDADSHRVTREHSKA